LARGAVRGIGRTIRFGFVVDIDIDCILVADFIKFLGRNQSERVGRWWDLGARRRRRFRRWLPRLHDRPFRFPPLAESKPAGVVAISPADRH
jgi:hypothetical protein